MKKTLQSYSSTETTGSGSKKLLVPSGAQLILYLLISALLLTLFNIRQLWEYLNNVILAGGGIGSILGDTSSGLGHLFNSLSHSIVLQVIFWICIGSLIYVLIWFGRNLMINILNDVVADNYLHPASYSRFHYWESVLLRKFFFSLSLLVLLFYIFAGSRLVGSFASVAYNLISHFSLRTSLLELGGIVLATMALVHSLVLIVQITIQSWRFIYRDL